MATDNLIGTMTCTDGRRIEARGLTLEGRPIVMLEIVRSKRVEAYIGVRPADIRELRDLLDLIDARHTRPEGVANG